MKKLHVAILGATGIGWPGAPGHFGGKGLSHCQAHPHVLRPLRRETGFWWGGKEYAVQEASPEAFQGVDVAFSPREGR